MTAGHSIMAGYLCNMYFNAIENSKITLMEERSIERVETHFKRSKKNDNLHNTRSQNARHKLHDLIELVVIFTNAKEQAEHF